MKNYSYWLDTIDYDLPKLSELPKNSDVLIIGFGYTGLNAAIQIAKEGRSVCVIDKNDFGEGCSSKNGGQISNLLKPSLEALTKKYGFEKAKQIRSEGTNALNWLLEFIKSENFKCDLVRDGRFHGAHTPEEYDKIAYQSQNLYTKEGIETYVVSKKDQKSEINTDLYHGGIVFPQHASLNPGKYHLELIKKAMKLGVQVVPKCEMKDFRKLNEEFSITTGNGVVKSQSLVIATNGYTSNVTPWLNRRNIPIGSYVIATEELPEDYINNLFPSNRHITDTCRVIYYFRPSPDKKRILFGGRVSSKEISLLKSGPLLMKDLTRVFPGLSNVKISHSWMGYVSYSFDQLPHIGCDNGLFYSMGYCGSGVALSSYLGMKLGKKVINKKDNMTAFDELIFPTRPFYNGRPWFLPALVELYKFRDSWEMNKYINRDQ